MKQSIYTKWIIGSAFLLLIIATGCILYYLYAESIHRQLLQDTLDDAEAYRQGQWAKTDTSRKKTASGTEGETLIAEKLVNKVTAKVGNNTAAKTEQSAMPAATDEVRVSKFGFGPYPELPADFPWQDLFDPPYYTEDPDDEYKDDPDYELMDRVWVELWKRGDNVTGMSTSRRTGLFYPTIRGTIYVEWAPRWKVFGQEFGRRIRAVNGDPDDVDALRAARQEGRPLLESDIPSHLKVLDMSEGIDPYTFLDLPK